MSTEEGNTDLATLHEEMIREKSIANIRKEAAKIDTSNHDGHCWNCGEFTGYARRWCDADCRDVYENR